MEKVHLGKGLMGSMSETDTIVMGEHFCSESVFRDSGLSWGAKGLYAFLVQLPSDWELRRNDLLSRSRDGGKRLREYLKELREGGYLVVQLVRDKGTGRVCRSRLVFQYDGNSGGVPVSVWFSEIEAKERPPGEHGDLEEVIYDAPDARV